MRYWLMKSEPSCYSIDDMKRDKKTMWDGVRNYQARNMMRDDMNVGDPVLFYHSNTDEIGVVGLAEVASKPYPDPTQFDKKNDHYDPKSKKENPTWVLVDIRFKKKFKKTITLAEIKNDPELSGMVVAQKGSRLSVQPVQAQHYARLLKLAS